MITRKMVYLESNILAIRSYLTNANVFPFSRRFIEIGNWNLCICRQLVLVWHCHCYGMVKGCAVRF